MRQVKVILREAVLGLGEAGDLVGVKVGYARNFLLPQGKALLATDSKVRELESKGSLSRLLLAARSALELRRVTGASLPDLLRSGLAMRRHERLTRTQMLMAANAPILATRAMQDGDPVGGYLPSGSVAGVIEDRPSCDELVRRIIEEAERTLKALGA